MLLPEQLIGLDLSRILAMDNGQISQEEINGLLSENNRELLERLSRIEDEEVKEIQHLENMIGGETESMPANSLPEFIASLDFSGMDKETLREITLGIEHGLPEEIILAYATSRTRCGLYGGSKKNGRGCSEFVGECQRRTFPGSSFLKIRIQ